MLTFKAPGTISICGLFHDKSLLFHSLKREQETMLETMPDLFLLNILAKKK